MPYWCWNSHQGLTPLSSQQPLNSSLSSGDFVKTFSPHRKYIERRILLGSKEKSHIRNEKRPLGRIFLTFFIHGAERNILFFPIIQETYFLCGKTVNEENAPGWCIDQRKLQKNCAIVSRTKSIWFWTEQFIVPRRQSFRPSDKHLINATKAYTSTSGPYLSSCTLSSAC